MSYILDALKKSEEKRSALHTPPRHPVVASIQTSKARRFGLPLILLILALLAGWLLAQWQQPDQQHESGMQNAHLTEQSHTAPTMNRNTFSIAQQGNAKVLKQNIPIQSPHVIHIDDPTPMFTPVTPASPITSTVTLSSRQPLPTNTIGSKNSEPLHPLAMSKAQSMPAIKIEGHIYDDDPSLRMVIINGQVRREKQVISAGLRLQEITSDGVILHYQGKDYHMGVFDQY